MVGEGKIHSGVLDKVIRTAIVRHLWEVMQAVVSDCIVAAEG
jgi:hypothetical protein